MLCWRAIIQLAVQRDFLLLEVATILLIHKDQVQEVPAGYSAVGSGQRRGRRYFTTTHDANIREQTTIACDATCALSLYHICILYHIWLCII